MKERVVKTCILMVVFLIAIVGISVSLNEKEEEQVENTDALAFKEEYEAYNNQERESDKGNYYQELTISDNNPIKYSTIPEIIDVLENKTGIIYLGFPTCPWCRNAVPVLLEAAEKENVKTIYYLNVNDYKNIFEIQDGEVVKTQEEKDGYYDLLQALDEILDSYILTDEDGTEYETGEKRIYVPLVLFVKDGELLTYHRGTVTLNEGQTKYDTLTDEQHEELLQIYLEAIEEMNTQDYCDEAC